MTQDEFDKWLTDNNHIWRAFEREALRVVRAGYEHYSARTIIEVLRHHSSLREKDGTWKINDHITPWLARHFLSIYPTLQIFETRGR